MNLYINIYLLFPLNCCRWFRCNIVHDTVDVLYFVYDTTGDCVQYVVRDACPVSSHEVCCCYATQCQCVVECTEVTITPTVRVDVNTAKYWLMLRSRPAFAISSRKM